MHARALVKALVKCSIMLTFDLLPRGVCEYLLQFHPMGKNEEVRALILKGGRLGGWKQFTNIFKSSMIQLSRTLEEDDRVPKIELVDFETKKSTTLNDLMRPGIPLVLNFGSCS